MAKLILNPSSPSRREITLPSAVVFTIGRDPSNDLVLPDAMVSRRHALVDPRAGVFYLRDCSSANGSVVNGELVSERGLCDGDLVAIGSARLLFREDPPESGSGKVVPHPSAVALRCPACRAEYRRGDLYCRDCGAQVAQPSGPPKLPCLRCGMQVAPPARFCTVCGGPLEDAAPGGDARGPADGPPLEAGPATGSLPFAPPPRSEGSMAIAPERPSSRPEPRAERQPAGREEPHRVGQRLAPAEPGSRLAAVLVDAVFVLSGQATLMAPVFWYWWLREAPRTPSDVHFLPVLASVVLALLAVLLGALYHVYFWSVRGATPGKELLDLGLVDEDGRSPISTSRALLRVFGYLLGIASLGVGFAAVAFGGSGLHDRIAGTRVVKVTRR